MAIRSIRTIGDEVLKKECKAVTEVTDHTLELIEDMFDTMYSAGGVGLAAPQVGIRKQIVVIDVEDGNQYVLINPVIEEMSGSQTGQEGCLSVPGKAGLVTRPSHVKVRALKKWKSLSWKQMISWHVRFAMSAIICTDICMWSW